MTSTPTPSTAGVPRADAPAAEGRMRLGSMLSMAYSGATLFSILLGRHRRITCDGETFPPPPRGYAMECSCGPLQIDCEYYREAAAHMLAPDGRSWNDDLFSHLPRYAGLQPLDRALSVFWINPLAHAARNAACATVPAWRRRQEEFLEAHHRFFVNSLRLNGTELYVDGAKSHRRTELLAASGRYDLRVLHLIRDGRGFCRSYIKNQKLDAGSLPAAARMWVRGIHRVDRFRRRFPGVPVLDVRYEDLCHDLHGTLERVCGFLGVEYDPAMAAPGEDSRTYHVIGNRMRFAFDGEVREDVSWRTALSEADLAGITRVMGPELERFGYT